MKVRAKSVLKIDTGQSTLDFTFNAGTDIEEVARHVISMLAFGRKEEETLAFVQSVLDQGKN